MHGHRSRVQPLVDPVRVTEGSVALNRTGAAKVVGSHNNTLVCTLAGGTNGGGRRSPHSVDFRTIEL